MKLGAYAFAIVVIASLTACEAGRSGEAVDKEKAAYVTLDADLGQLKTDFNAMTDKVRLVFISGPSCGICLRGMDDLNQAIVASVQNDPRIHTFVVQVPALGAEEKHAAASVSLMPGPRVNHYWDPGGRSGIEFQESLDIRYYAWDVWMVYEPGVRWESESPLPAPAFWQHQLPPLPDENRLDADVFASVVKSQLAKLPPSTEISRMAAVQEIDPGMLNVAQPRGLMIQNNHASRGGYQQIKTIVSIRYEGETIIGGQSYPLTIETSRPNNYSRTVSSDAGESFASWDGTEVIRQGPSIDLLANAQDEWLASYEFDGWMTDWKGKGHLVWRLGMKKHGTKLPWIMEAELANGRTWHIYVDSHTGDAYRQSLVGADGQEIIVVEFDDYRDADDFRLPHVVRYYDEDGLLATDRFQKISVERKSPAVDLRQGET